MVSFKTLALISYLASSWLSLWIWRSDESIATRVMLTFLVLIPVLGPIAYFWIANWPEASPRNLDGRSAGRGARYLNRALSRKSGGMSLYDRIDDELRAMPNHAHRSPKTRDIEVESPNVRIRSRIPNALLIPALLLLGILLASVWAHVAHAFLQNSPWAYTNSRGRPVGSVLLLAIAIAATPTYIIVWFRYLRFILGARRNGGRTEE